jgi:hypothetical protein
MSLLGNDNHTEFTITYEGVALQTHSMDVRYLSPALLSLSNLFDESNRVLNGDNTNIRLHVKAHEAGSFEILFDLSQSFGAQVSNFLTGNFVTSAINLKEIILGGSISLIGLIKWLKGKKPHKYEDLKNGYCRIEFEGKIEDFPLELMRLYQEISVRTAIKKILEPLEEDGIESFTVSENKKTIQQIKKEDLDYFIVPSIEDEKINEFEKEAAYSIISLTFKESNKWRLFDGNSTINVLIKDAAFLEKVEKSQISFTKGDILICRVKTVQWETLEGLKTEYELLKVLEHKHALRQLGLF